MHLTHEAASLRPHLKVVLAQFTAAAMSVRQIGRITCAVVYLIFGLKSTALSFNFVPIDVPGATETRAHGINENGQVVGSFLETANRLDSRGFLYDNGQFTTINVPGATTTFGLGINDRSQIVGQFIRPTSGPPVGFPEINGYLFDKGTFATISEPRGQDAGPILHGINNKGQIVGEIDTGFGFLREKNGQITMIGDVQSRITRAFDINNRGQIVGTSQNHGFLLDKNGSLATIEIPGARRTDALGINDLGQIVGSFLDANNQEHGFLSQNGNFTTVDVPGATFTTVTGINNHGWFVGFFRDATGIHGFIDPPAEVPEPTSLLLFGAGLIGLMAWRQGMARW